MSLANYDAGVDHAAPTMPTMPSDPSTGGRADYNRLSGTQKAAIMIMAVGEDHVARLFSLMDNDEINEISASMASLGTVNARLVERLFHEFAEHISSPGSVVGSYESTERLLNKVLDNNRVAAIMEDIRGPAGRTMWDKLANVDEGLLANYLRNEYPQTVAVVLTKLSSAQTTPHAYLHSSRKHSRWMSLLASSAWRRCRATSCRMSNEHCAPSS
jgi:flagellar motor switch protein FliG